MPPIDQEAIGSSPIDPLSQHTIITIGYGLGSEGGEDGREPKIVFIDLYDFLTAGDLVLETIPIGGLLLPKSHRDFK